MVCFKKSSKFFDILLGKGAGLPDPIPRGLAISLLFNNSKSCCEVVVLIL